MVHTREMERERESEGKGGERGRGRGREREREREREGGEREGEGEGERGGEREREREKGEGEGEERWRGRGRGTGREREKGREGQICTQKWLERRNVPSMCREVCLVCVYYQTIKSTRLLIQHILSFNMFYPTMQEMFKLWVMYWGNNYRSMDCKDYELFLSPSY